MRCGEQMTPAQYEWARCRPHIEAALERSPGLETIEDVERRIADGRYMFWPGRKSAAITEIVEYDRKRAMVMIHGGGDMGEMLDEMEPVICAMARLMGCSMIMGTGRKGWEKPGLKRGYKFGWITMYKDLT